MMERWRISRCKPVVAALYAVAMLTLGFAHSHASQPEASAIHGVTFQAATFVLPDGAFPPICGPSKSGDPAHRSAAVPCDACWLTAAPGAIPTPPPMLDAPLLAMKLPPVRVVVSVAETAALEPQSRGPPLFS